MKINRRRSSRFCLMNVIWSLEDRLSPWNRHLTFPSTVALDRSWLLNSYKPWTDKRGRPLVFHVFVRNIKYFDRNFLMFSKKNLECAVFYSLCLRSLHFFPPFKPAVSRYNDVQFLLIYTGKQWRIAIWSSMILIKTC